MVDFFIKIFGVAINFFWPGKLKELQIKIKRIDTASLKELQNFVEVYEETFPFNGNNYTASEMLAVLEDIDNSKKHVLADNIFLVAKFKDSIIGFIVCFYYPQKRYGIIGYLGKARQFKDEEKYMTPKLLNSLKKELTKKHKCELLIFELELDQRENSRERLFRMFAKTIDLSLYEIVIDYHRPKLNLQDKEEKKLRLMIIPFTKVLKSKITKAKTIDILEFLHFYCYGDYYDKKDKNFKEFQNYMRVRIDYYKENLPNSIMIK